MRKKGDDGRKNENENYEVGEHVQEENPRKKNVGRRMALIKLSKLLKKFH